MNTIELAGILNNDGAIGSVDRWADAIVANDKTGQLNQYGNAIRFAQATAKAVAAK